MRKRVLILGSTGMLGNDVVQLFQQNKDLLTKTTYRTPVEGFEGSVKFDALTDPIEKTKNAIENLLICIKSSNVSNCQQVNLEFNTTEELQKKQRNIMYLIPKNGISA